MSSLSQQEQAEVMKVIERVEAEDRLRMQNQLVEMCFSDCANNFRMSTLDKNETKCLNFCTDKFLAFNGKVGQSYQEKQNEFAS
jgi:mitochondrial import inner membrane translocase subunit TIM9